MIPDVARVTVLAPMAWLPRRGRHPRLGYVHVDLLARTAKVAQGDAPCLMVHSGQGRSHARPIHAIGGRLFTPVVRTSGWVVAPRPAAYLVEAAASAAGIAGLAADPDARTSLLSTPLLPGLVASDARIPLVSAADLAGARILVDGRDEVREAGRRWFEDDVRFVGDAALVAMGGPLLHLDKDLWTLRASLNPALVDPRSTGMPVFHPFRDELALALRLRDAGIARGPAKPAAAALDHLDTNESRPPLDLRDLPSLPDEASKAAAATARMAPLQALILAAPALRAPGADEAMDRAAFDVGVDRAFALLGQAGPGEYADTIARACALVDRAGEAVPDIAARAAPYLAELAAGTAILRPEAEPSDQAALTSLAPERGP